MVKKHTSLHNIINELVDRTNTDTQRIRALEQGDESTATRLESAEQELININQTLQKVQKDLDKGFKNRDASINQLQSTIKEIIKHVKKLAPSDKLNELQAMVEIYNPLKSNFMIREEVEDLIRHKIKESAKRNK